MAASPTLSSTASTGVQRETNANYTFAFSIVTTLFFIFGFITCLNDILVPHLKALFTLDYTQAALVQFCFFAAYFVVSIPAGRVVSKLGYQNGTVIGLLITAVGCFMFYPAASYRSYPLFLFGLFVLAMGITLIQVAVNPYIAVLGPAKTASSRLTLAQAFNSLGTTLAPLLGAIFILSATADAIGNNEAAQASAVQVPYLILAGILIALGLIVKFVKLPQISSTESQDVATSAHDKNSAWDYRHLVLGAIAIFCYVGAEVGVGSYLVNFLGLSDVMSMEPATAGRYVAYYWGAAMVGRFIGSAVMTKVSPRAVLAINAIIAAALCLAAMATTGHVAMIAILAIGLFNSIMFPTIFTLAIDGLGKNTAQGSGILCAAIVGGAIVPLAQGWIADALGLHHSYWLPVVCYLYIGYFALRGFTAKDRTAVTA